MSQIWGDARYIPLVSESVQCVVTSPPYWDLRDYGTARWVGGDPECEHVGSVMRTAPAGTEKQASNKGSVSVSVSSGNCLCGAERIDQQIGLETTPAEYVASIVQVFSEVRRVLKDDGTVWLNLGDCYATGAGKVGEHPGGGAQGARWRGDVDRIRDDKRGYRGDRLVNTNSGNIERPKTRALRDGTHAGKNIALAAMGPMSQPNRMPIDGLKPKDLVGIPWRVAFALQAAGWYLRSDVIWSKPNPMPESVTDRPTKSHEYVFLLTKSREYYYDAEAISEPVSGAMYQQMADGYFGQATKEYEQTGAQNPSSVKERIIAGAIKRSGNKARRSNPGRPENDPRNQQGSVPWEGLTRNKRTVWTIRPVPYAEAHFATMPEALVEPCILAGAPVGGLVLDPFFGSGTVGAVAERLGRRWVGLDLNPSYHRLAARRTSQRGLRFGE